MTPIATFLDGGTVDVQRGLMWLALSARGSLLSTGGSSDAGGGQTGGTATYGSAFPCRIDPLSGGETVIAGRIDERTSHVLTVPAEIDPSPSQQVSVDGTLFEITAIRERTRAMYRVVEIVEAD